MLPQFDTNYFSSQIFWLSILFVIIYVFIKYKVMRDVEEIIAKREKNTNDQLSLSQQYENSANEIILEIKKIKSDSLEESRILKENMISEVQKFQDQEILKMSNKIKKERENFKHQLEQEFQEYQKFIPNITEKLSIILKKKISQEININKIK